MKGLGDDFNTEALRVTQLIRFEKPAMQNGKPVKVQYTVPVEFKLPNQTEIKKKGGCP